MEKPIDFGGAGVLCGLNSSSHLNLHQLIQSGGGIFCRIERPPARRKAVLMLGRFKRPLDDSKDKLAFFLAFLRVF